MKDKIIIDLGQMMDEIFQATESFHKAFQDGFKGHKDGGFPFRKWDDNVDYYPAHSYPPANVYITSDKSLVFEFALAGFEEKCIDLEFRGDYMVLNVSLPESRTEQADVRYFKRRLRFKEISDQRYFAPEDKFDHARVNATWKNGVLTVRIPAKEDAGGKQGVKINIVTEEE